MKLAVVPESSFEDRDDRLLTIEELGAYLAVPTATLYNWRYLGKGPPGFRVGRHVRYRWRDIETWIRDRLAGAPPQSVG
ncbi:MAG TPA: helix-turn-helix domain-containing protein [Acidimicrobiia bacterium]|nr:helix-turn-helix domain-containing protein [Acidimicrobiia bacterium]